VLCRKHHHCYHQRLRQQPAFLYESKTHRLRCQRIDMIRLLGEPATHAAERLLRESACLGGTVARSHVHQHLYYNYV
jgi:hypothetical protein